MKEYNRGYVDGMLKLLHEFDEFTEISVKVSDGETVMERIVREIKEQTLGDVKGWMLDEIRERAIPKEEKSGNKNISGR